MMHDADDDGIDHDDKEWSRLLKADDMAPGPPPDEQTDQVEYSVTMSIQHFLYLSFAFFLSLTALLGHYGAFDPAAPSNHKSVAASSVNSLSAEARIDWQRTIDRCEDLHLLPGPPDNFLENRQTSDRATDVSPAPPSLYSNRTLPQRADFLEYA